ncbi:MAG: class I SAM-dependent methyltransferase [Gammaproteobacteria bacterium]|jgi:SAM-dependent methyltransferase
MTFRDHFSGVSEGYSRYRPRYPESLFVWLAAEAPARGLAWDCATGSGQAAAGLARHFRQVEATDASARQIESAPQMPGVRYRVAPADASGLGPGSADLVTVAQALHWFDTEDFHAELARVLRADGLFAAWCYQLCRVEPSVDDLILALYRDVLGPYWPAERRHIESGYETLRSPWPRLQTPSFRMEAAWEAADMLGYLATWSAVQRCRRATGEDPLSALVAPLRRCWGPGRRQVVWPLSMLACRKPPED